MNQWKILATMTLMVLTQACATGTRIDSVELTPAPNTQLHQSDTLKAKFAYHIAGYSARREYRAWLMFERGDAQHTRSAPHLLGSQVIQQPDGQVELEVPVSALVAPSWGLSTPLRAWLYINRATGPNHSEPILRKGPFVFPIERTPSH